MSSAPRLSELLIRWLELRNQGQDPSPAELCSHCPELEDELRRRVQALEGMESFLGMAELPRTTDVTPTQPGAVGPALPAALDADTIPGYEILGELGRGGMGVVYQARQVATKRTVALKVMLQGRHASPRQKLRFEREVDLVASLRHPHIVTIYDSGTTGHGLPYFVMEYIDGQALDEYLRQGSPRSLPDTLQLFIRICSAVNYAHQRGVIHRDLKPANIRIDAGGEPHILDFGLAKTLESEAEGLATVPGEFLGTLAYASPEQARGDPNLIDTRTDVYALGVILYEVLSGVFPYPVTGHFPAVLRAIAEIEPEPLSAVRLKQPRPAAYRIDETLDAIVLKALVKERDQRYQSAGALAEDLRHYLAGEPIQARAPGLGLLLRLWFRQNFRAAFWTVMVGLVCGGLSAGLIGVGRLLPFMNYCAAAYQRFPSLPPPWLAIGLTLPDWLVHLLTVIGALAFVGMGLFTALLVRPRNRSGDLIAGTTTGVVGGITAFIVTGGWATILAIAVFPSLGDTHLLGARYPDPAGAEKDVLVERFPDLAEVPAEERGLAVYNKMVADMLVRIPLGIWLGMLFTLGTFSVSGVYGTLVAGMLLRRHGAVRAVLLPYLEVTIPGAWLIFVLFMQAFFHRGNWPNTNVSGWLIVMLFAILAVLAPLAFVRRWDWPIRSSLYAAWGITLVRLTSGTLPWFVDLLVYVLVAMVLIRHLLRRRRIEEPAGLRQLADSDVAKVDG